MASSSNLYSDPQKMISCFRVLELKQFLKSVGIVSSGKKSELQERATRLVSTNDPKILKALTDLYQSTFTSSSHSKSLPKPPISHSTAKPPSFHVKHPDVRLKGHAFYQHLDTVHRVTALESSSYMKKSMTIQFHLSPQHIRNIFESESTPGNYQTQVVLRFCKKETSCEQEDFYPGNCFVTINSQQCPIPGYNPNYSMRPEYKRNGRPINITTYVHTSAAIVNTMSITWSHDIIYSQGFCFAIDLMNFLSSTDLLHKLKVKGFRSPDVSKALIKQKLLSDRDSEISTTSLKISLLCPLSMTRLCNPCKSTSCDHLQCFDASTYLQMNERKPKWVCPVCDRPAPFLDLLIDGYLLEICQKSVDDLIEFDTDGSWHSISKSNKDKVVSLTPPTSITISDSPIMHPKQSSSMTSMGVIDLTESDDEIDLVRPSPPPSHISMLLDLPSFSHGNKTTPIESISLTNDSNDAHSIPANRTDSNLLPTSSSRIDQLLASLSCNSLSHCLGLSSHSPSKTISNMEPNDTVTQAVRVPVISGGHQNPLTPTNDKMTVRIPLSLIDKTKIPATLRDRSPIQLCPKESSKESVSSYKGRRKGRSIRYPAFSRVATVWSINDDNMLDLL